MTKDDITRAIIGLDMFTKNWCMDCEGTKLLNMPIFRCGECEFRTDDGRCKVKIFAINHKSEFDMNDFGCMAR